MLTKKLHTVLTDTISKLRCIIIKKHEHSQKATLDKGANGQQLNTTTLKNDKIIPKHKI